MKKRIAISVLLILLAVFSSCNRTNISDDISTGGISSFRAPAAPLPPETDIPPIYSDDSYFQYISDRPFVPSPVTGPAIQWADGGMEAIIRIVLRRREGDIYQGELDSIFDLRIWTVWENTVGIYINDEQICVGDMLFDGDHIINRLDDVFHLPNLNAIQISKSNISDLSPLAGLEHIETIYIHDAPISDISPLQAMTNVSVLGLLDCPITDISALRGLIEMRRLRLENLAISDLSPLKNMTKLEQLGIVNTDINNLDFLPKIEMIKFLFIHDNANLCDISAIGNIKQIDVLYLDNNKIKDPTPLTKLKRLTHLQIQFNEIEYIAPIAKINGLETAFIFGNPVKDLDEYAGDIRISNEYT